MNQPILGAGPIEKIKENIKVKVSNAKQISLENFYLEFI